MSTPRWTRIAPALPPEVVDDIWREVGAAQVPLRTTDERLRAFVEIAIDHPHYATSGEIAAALGESTNRVNPHVYRTKDDARRARKTGEPKQ